MWNIADWPAFTAIAATAGSAALAALTSRFATRLFRRDVDDERTRLRDVIKIEYIDLEAQRSSSGSASKVDSSAPETALVGDKEDARFMPLLLEYYAHGLVEARNSSSASRISAWLGLSVIVLGVVMAIISAFALESSSGLLSSIVVSGSGVLTNAVGVLFHRQANKALSHMEKQTASLQRDMRAVQDGRNAIDLINRISDQELRDRTLAAVVLRLTRAESSAVPVFDQSDGVSPGEGSVAGN